MSKTRWKPEAVILIVLGVASAGLILLMLSLSWLDNAENPSMWRPTSYSMNAEGTLICYALFGQLDIAVDRCEAPLLDDLLRNLDVLLVIEPRYSMRAAEQLALDRWVSAGGVLVAAGCLQHAFFEGLDATAGQGDPQTVCPTCSGRLCTTKELPAEPSAGAVPAAQPDLALARDVSVTWFKTDATVSLEDVATQPAHRQLPIEPTYVDQTGVRIAQRPQGRGLMIFAADASFLTNEMISRHDNGILAVNLATYALSHARGQRVGFDEFHHGFGVAHPGRDVLLPLLVQTSPGWAVVCLTVGGILFLVHKGRRFGRRVAPKRVRRRSKLEYVYSVGAAWSAAKANRLTLERVYHAVIQALAASLHLAPSVSTGRLAEVMARQTDQPRRRYLDVFDSIETALTHPRLSERRMRSLLDRLSTIEREFPHADRTGKSGRPTYRHGTG